MQVSQLRRLRTLITAARYAHAAGQLEYYARQIAAIIADVDAEQAAVALITGPIGRPEVFQHPCPDIDHGADDSHMVFPEETPLPLIGQPKPRGMMVGAAPEASPDTGHHCHSPGLAATHAIENTLHPATDGPNAAPLPPATGSAEPATALPAPATVAKPTPTAHRTKTRPDHPVNRSPHPMFADDPIAVADYSGPRYAPPRWNGV